MSGISISEQLRGRDVVREADGYFKKYRKHIEVLESSSILSKLRSIQPMDVYNLGRQLEMWEAYKSFTEEDGTVAALGKIPDIAFDVITAVYGTSPISSIASVQPIEEERGIVYYKSVVAQNTRGNVDAGDRIVSVNTPPDVSPVGYASDTTSVVLSTTAGATTVYSGTLANAPIKPGSVRLAIQDIVAPNLDDGLGNILGSGMSGTINYTSGAVSITFASQPATGKPITAVYQTNFEAATDIPKIISKMDSKSVNARVFALKSTIGLEQSYAMRRRFGMVAEDEVAADLVAAINAEIVNTMIVQLSAAATGVVTNWPKTAPAGVSYPEHKQTILDALATAESQLLAQSGIGAGITCMIAGRTAAAILSTLPNFVRISDGTASFGPHVYGTLNGATVVRVPDSSILAGDSILCLFNGATSFQSAAVYAPYMPLVITSALPAGQNPLLNQKAAAVWAAVDVLVPQFITKINFV